MVTNDTILPIISSPILSKKIVPNFKSKGRRKYPELTNGNFKD